jgi:hypothetical protein
LTRRKDLDVNVIVIVIVNVNVAPGLFLTPHHLQGPDNTALRRVGLQQVA